MANKWIVDWQIQELVDDLGLHTGRTLKKSKPSRHSRAATSLDADLLAWSRYFLPEHFRLPPSDMHVWLAQQLDGMRRGNCSRHIPCAVRSAGTRNSNIQASTGDGTRSVPATRGIKLNVVGPRGSAKSTVATLAFVLREAVSGREPYIWIVSDTRHQADAHLENIKAELCGNSKLAAAYPEATGRGPSWRTGAAVLNNGVMIEAFGTGQRIRGRRRRENRPTLIVCDDLQNDGHIQSATARNRSRSWFHGLVMKAGTKRTHVVNLGTALHRECLAMELNRTPGWTSRLFRAIERWPDQMQLWAEWEEIYCEAEGLSIKPPMVSAVNCEWTNNSAAPPMPSAALCNESRKLASEFYDRNRAAMNAGAELLWPHEEDLYTLMCMRAESGSTAFEREKQSTPINPDLCEWPENYFGDWIWFDEWPGAKAEFGIRKAETNDVAAAHSAFRTPPSDLASKSIPHSPFHTPHSATRLTLRVIALDPSKGSDSRHGDYSAFIMLGIGGDGTLYVEADLARRPTPQMVSDGVELCRRFRPQVFGIEANQFQELLGADFTAELARQQVFGVVPYLIENNTNKAVRIRRLGPWLAARRVRFKTNSPGTRMLVEQLKEFPLARHDDGPDALEMALRLAEAFLRAPVCNDGLGDRLI